MKVVDNLVVIGTNNYFIQTNTILSWKYIDKNIYTRSSKRGLSISIAGKIIGDPK